MKLKISNKNIFIITVCFQFIVFSAILTKNILIKLNAENNNRVYTFDCTFYDPYDLLKGRYIQLNIKQEVCNKANLDMESFTEGKVDKLLKNEIVYVLLKPDENGFWNICGVRQTKPKNQDFIKAKFFYSNDEKYHFCFMCDEYYMQENFAKYVDTLRGNDLLSIKLEIYSDMNGNVLQKQMYLAENNKYVPVEEYVKQKVSIQK